MAWKSTRFYERIILNIPLEVFYSESADEEWTENTLTEDVTAYGAGFTLSRPVEPKRLIRLKLPMPKKYRLVEYGQEQYDIWALIRYVLLIEPNADNEIRVMVGAAFIGKNPPRGFENDPKTLYDLKPILRRQNFWDLHQLPRNTGPYVRSAEERHPFSIIIILQILDQQGRIIESVEAETLNISESGMALKAELKTDCPHFVLVKNADKSIYFLAAVRSSFQLDFNNALRLHLEFISGKWAF